MFVTGKCKVCGGTVVMDIADFTPEQVDAKLKQSDFGHCKAGGFHVELGKMSSYYIIDWTALYETSEEARSRTKNT